MSAPAAAAAKPRMVGSINCHTVSPFVYGGRVLHFDGTLTGLINTAREFGAAAGDIVQASFGLCDWVEYRLTAAPHDARCGGLWAEQTRRIGAYGDEADKLNAAARRARG